MSNDDSDLDWAEPPTVLVAAADQSFRSFVEYTLRSKGFVTFGEADGEALARRLQIQTPDILLIESRLPDADVPSLCARLRLDRRTRSMLIVVLAAGGDEASQQLVLDAGADQYLGRPISPETLITSITAVLREASRTPTLAAQDLLTFLDLELDLSSYRVRRNGRTIHLAPTEFRLLQHLMKNPQKVCSRDELKSAAWPRAVHLGPRTIDVHIGRLRAALNEAGGQALIRTVRSFGYALSD
jgi:two-component system, OmpR family, phosphate regulon response regulator PhoB